MKECEAFCRDCATPISPAYWLSLFRRQHRFTRQPNFIKICDSCPSACKSCLSFAVDYLFGQNSRPTFQRHAAAAKAIYLARPTPTRSFRTAKASQGSGLKIRTANGENPERFAIYELSLVNVSADSAGALATRFDRRCLRWHFGAASIALRGN